MITRPGCWPVPLSSARVATCMLFGSTESTILWKRHEVVLKQTLVSSSQDLWSVNPPPQRTGCWHSRKTSVVKLQVVIIFFKKADASEINTESETKNMCHNKRFRCRTTFCFYGTGTDNMYIHINKLQWLFCRYCVTKRHGHIRTHHHKRKSDTGGTLRVCIM